MLTPIALRLSHVVVCGRIPPLLINALLTPLSSSFLPPLPASSSFLLASRSALSQAFLAALKEASDRGVVIVNITQCGKGIVEGHCKIRSAGLIHSSY